MTAEADATTAIAELERQVEAACIARDTGFLAGVYSDDFTMLHGDGRLTPKPVWLEIVRSGQEAWTSRELSDHVVDLHGDVALTLGRLAIATPAGRRYSLGYVRVWAEREGRWRLLLHRTLEIHDL